MTRHLPTPQEPVRKTLSFLRPLRACRLLGVLSVLGALGVISAVCCLAIPLAMGVEVSDGDESAVYAQTGERGNAGFDLSILTGEDDEGGEPEASLSGTAVTMERLGGANRYATMKEIACKGFAQGRKGTVIVASGEGFADALAASALAGVLDAPVVLTSSTELSSAARETITYLDARKVVVVGGPSAVSEEVFASLEALVGVGAVSRLAGEDRYETARTIFGQGAARSAWSSDTCILASGENFPDALSASPLAFKAKMPLFLVRGEGLDQATLETILAAGFSHVIILGGPNAVDAGTEQALVDALGRSAVERLEGADRYETSVAIAEYAVGKGILSYEDVTLAAGKNFPDALAGASLCGKLGSVLLLVDPYHIGCVSSELMEHRGEVRAVYVLGGRAAVSESLYAFVRDVALKGLIPASAPAYLDRALAMSLDDTIGYSQATRRLNPNVDCSSFVYYTLLKSGIENLDAVPFWTGVMQENLTRAGFTEYPYLEVKDSLQAGDILLNRQYHTEIVYNPDAKLTIGASDDYDGVDGDGSGTEVAIRTRLLDSSSDSFWEYVYRLED